MAAFDFFLNQPSTHSQSPINPVDAICHACWYKFLRYNTSISKPSEQSAQAIQLSIPRATYSEQRCVFGCKEFGRFRVPDDVRAQVLRNFRYFIGEGARVCASHNKCYWSEVPPGSSTLYDSTHIEDMLDLLRQSSSSQQCSVVNFDYIDSMTDDDIHKWTSLTKEQFQDLLGRLKYLQEQEKRHLETALALYLGKLRTGESDERLTDIFAVGSRRTSERLMSKTRTALYLDCVPVYIGFDNSDRERILERSTVTARFDNSDRERILERSTVTARKLFFNEGTNAAIVIWDGTYILIQKSNDYSFQRASYSQQKHRPLLKPMLYITPSGYIIDIFGPYPANQNDASIMKQILKSKPEETIPKGHNQLDTESANRSRLVTKCRYIVEVINRMLKSRFRLFDHAFQNKSLGHLMTDFRIAGVLLSAYETEVHSEVGYEEQIAE
ncbi:hypothetical protein KQX54_010902 [Cotesia glomerata]|uniref:DDE Tnp4 domain-containing protein n=1 Tax=Cotesia glomerata TaxID=32391 RepID=A0AAV7I457_COTGL|nr:hypothetical protein KQX54_010902 [Cotesia glomerata]